MLLFKRFHWHHVTNIHIYYFWFYHLIIFSIDHNLWLIFCYILLFYCIYYFWNIYTSPCCFPNSLKSIKKATHLSTFLQCAHRVNLDTMQRSIHVTPSEAYLNRQFIYTRGERGRKNQAVRNSTITLTKRSGTTYSKEG